jgi:hypothetical protein
MLHFNLLKACLRQFKLTGFGGKSSWVFSARQAAAARRIPTCKRLFFSEEIPVFKEKPCLLVAKMNFVCYITTIKISTE